MHCGNAGASLTRQREAGSKPRLPEGHSPAFRKGKTPRNHNKRAARTSTAGNAGERFPRSEDQPFASRSSTDSHHRPAQGAVAAEAFASEKGESPSCVPEISRGLAPTSWRPRVRSRGTIGINGNRELRRHGSPWLCDARGERAGKGLTLWESCTGGCGLVVLGVNISVIPGQDRQSGGAGGGVPNPSPRRCHQIGAAAGGD